MNSGLLWFDDSKKSMVEKIVAGCKYYEKKYGILPNTCQVHPDMLSGQNIKEGLPDDVSLRTSRVVLKHHFYIGVENEETIQPAVSAV